jgi:hypothetical protein
MWSELAWVAGIVCWASIGTAAYMILFGLLGAFKEYNKNQKIFFAGTMWVVFFIFITVVMVIS